MQKKATIDPAAIDRAQKDNATYWAARVMVAIRERDREGENQARAELRRLGYDVTRVRPRRQGVTHATR